MSGFRLLVGVSCALLSLTALARPGDSNHFAFSQVGSACVFAVEARTEALDILFRSPDTLVMQSTYQFIGGSGIKLTFDDGSQYVLGNLNSASSREVSGTLSADAIAAFSAHQKVTIGSESIRGPLYRKIGLADFAAGYKDYSSCVSKK